MVKWSTVAFLILGECEAFLQTLGKHCAGLRWSSLDKGLPAWVVCAGTPLSLRASKTAREDCNEGMPFTEKPEMFPEPLLGAGQALCRGWALRETWGRPCCPEVYSLIEQLLVSLLSLPQSQSRLLVFIHVEVVGTRESMEADRGAFQSSSCQPLCGELPVFCTDMSISPCETHPSLPHLLIHVFKYHCQSGLS